MEILNRKKNDAEPSLMDDLAQRELSRRKFLRFSGLAGVSAAVIAGSTLAGCSKDESNGDGGVDLGSGDFGILNYAYALEQLEAAFYTQVVANGSFGTIFSDLEQEYLRDVRDHEIAHREFFKAALSSNAIPALEVNFASINFGDRNSVLTTARTFEDLGVAAYNGAGKLITSPDYLTIAGKIVSVEARHAALIRDLISNGSFADLSSLSPFGADNATAKDGALNPPEVLAAAAPFIKTRISSGNLPTA